MKPQASTPEQIIYLVDDDEALGFKQPDEGVAQGFVVIHEVDDLFRRRGLRFH